MRVVLVFGVLGVMAGQVGCGDDAAAPVDGGGGADGGRVDGGREPDAGDPGDAGPECTGDPDCDDGEFCNGDETCTPGSPSADARGCLAAAAPACLPEQTCDEDMRECLSDCATAGDADGDMHRAESCGGDDCDDSDATRFPGNPEVCDAADHDEDCDTSTFGIRDADMDDEPDAECCNVNEGLGGDTVCGTDCDDTRAGVRPGATETCNTRDDDCDGMIDDGATVALYLDADMDGFGDATMSMMGCPGMVPGHVLEGTDCDDMESAISPSAPDICDPDLIDQDCNGTPNDPPGGCACTLGMMRDCTAEGICAAGVEMCLDGTFGSCSIMPEPFEVCDLEDDDCNGVVDDGLRRDCWIDGDSDGYARMGATMSFECATPGGGCPAGYTPRAPTGSNVDCDDMTSARSPAVTEVCFDDPAVDEDCDGMTNEGLTVNCYVDQDNDAYAPTGALAEGRCPNMARASVGFCPFGYTNRAPASAATRDCNDSVGSGFDVHPGAPELCDMVDNDCDGMVDDGARVTCFTDTDDDGYAIAGAMSSMQCRAMDRTDRGDCPRFFTFRDPAVVADRDCNATDPSIHPGATEICDGIDQDCDGSTTDVMMVTCYTDDDDDGYAAMGIASSLHCPDSSRMAVGLCPDDFTNRAPTPTVFDCAPIDPTRHPGVTEMCDPGFVDANCNGMADEGAVNCFRDMDEDGWALLGATGTMTCIEPTRAGEPHLGCPTGFTGRAPTDISTADCSDTRMADHTIVQCYSDGDRDSYRLSTDMSLSNECYTLFGGHGFCPLGMTTRFTEPDCCDSDIDAHPNQLTYFTTPVNCGGFDYNCSGVVTMQYTAVSTGVCGGSGIDTPGECEGISIPDGWDSGVAPCGVGGWRVDCRWVVEDGFGFCEDEYEAAGGAHAAQGCR